MPDSPIGFGGADWFAFSLTALLIGTAFIWRAPLQHRLERFAGQKLRAMLVLFALPILLRLLLLSNHPVPTPNIYDEFSHLLGADTLLHLRLANPPHPLHQFFETFFVLQQPSYSSIYPPGQALLLAVGKVVSGYAWTGVLLATGTFCALCHWMLCPYVGPGWAFLGGLLAVAQFGPLNSWTNSYWGGMLAAVAGCLVFGALPRLRERWVKREDAEPRDAMLLGAGLGMHVLTRQFQSVFLLLSIITFLLPLVRKRALWKSHVRTFGITGVAVLPALILTAVQNRAATKSWSMLPERLSQIQYGLPTTLTIQPPARPQLPLTREQALAYRAQALMHGPDRDTWARFLDRLQYRVRDYRFFFLPPLYLALVAFALAWREWYFGWLLATFAFFALGTNLFPYLLVQYLAALTCLFVLVSVEGLRQISRLEIRAIPVGRGIVQLIVVLCFTPAVLWYGLHLSETWFPPSSLLQFETWDEINHGNPERRIAVAKQVAEIPGRLLIFVHYTPRHIFQDEWVWNAADIDTSRVVWARDLGAVENEKLIHYYPNRKVILFEPDLATPRLSLYPTQIH